MNRQIVGTVPGRAKGIASLTVVAEDFMVGLEVLDLLGIGLGQRAALGGIASVDAQALNVAGIRKQCGGNDWENGSARAHLSCCCRVTHYASRTYPQAFLYPVPQQEYRS